MRIIKYTIEDCRNSALLREGKCLSNSYVNCKERMLWGCSCGFEWYASYDAIKNQGQWCPKCAGNQVSSIDDMKNIASEHEGFCLSIAYKNAHIKLLWRCKYNHELWATPHMIKRGRWCPDCSGHTRLTIKHAKNLALKNNGECLSHTITKSKNKLQWRCENKHIFMSSYDNVKSGKWCAECASGKTQKTLANLIRDIFENKYIILVNFTDFDWLKTDITKKGGKQELDIYIPELKLAIEYDGEQHFKPVRFGGMSLKKAEKQLKIVKRLDKIKNNKIKNHPEDIVHFIRFNYKEPLTKEYITSKLRNIGVEV